MKHENTKWGKHEKENEPQNVEQGMSNIEGKPWLGMKQRHVIACGDHGNEYSAHRILFCPFHLERDKQN